MEREDNKNLIIQLKIKSNITLFEFCLLHFAFSLTQTIVMPTQEASQTVSLIVIYQTQSDTFFNPG